MKLISKYRKKIDIIYEMKIGNGPWLPSSEEDWEEAKQKGTLHTKH
jgi:hypothetical protein